MSQRRNLVVLGLSALLFACTATGEAQRPIVTAALGKVVEGLATEIGQRQATEALRGLPVVVRGGANSTDVSRDPIDRPSHSPARVARPLEASSQAASANASPQR